MIIKKFQAKTEEEAVATAKREMGENVVIMSTRNVKKKGLFALFSKPLVEITVGMEEESANQISAAFSAIAKSAVVQNSIKQSEEAKSGANDFSSKAQDNASSQRRIAEYQNVNSYKETGDVLEKRLDSLQSLLEKQLVKENDEKELAKASDDATVKFLKLIYNTLIDNEVDEKYVNEVMDEIGKIKTPNTNVDTLLANIYQKMILKFGQPVTIPIDVEKRRVIFFIGPTGVGKTTTIAKLASALCVNHKKKVVLLTTDTYRIAAAEQLRTYASILNTPFKVVYTEDEMVAAVDDYKDYDYILVDTAGHSHQNQEQKDSVNHFLNCINEEEVDKDVYLVMSATTKYRDLLAISDSYSEITDYKLIFTKLDETSTYGSLFNLCMHTGASMSYITFGQNVPDDIEVFSPQTTVKQLLGGK